MLRLHRLIRPKHVVRRFVKDDSEKFLNLEKFKEQEKQEREKPLSEKYPTIEVKPREISDEPNWIQKRWQKFRLWIERSNMDIKVAILVAFLFFLYNVNYYRTWNVHENNGYHLRTFFMTCSCRA